MLSIGSYWRSDGVTLVFGSRMSYCGDIPLIVDNNHDFNDFYWRDPFRGTNAC
ncbi:hypothetical protein C8D96_1802 [Kushneria marisflavi]|nr:hypothetical protein C8D96_1802 [Kushneria marisflavi]